MRKGVEIVCSGDKGCLMGFIGHEEIAEGIVTSQALHVLCDSNVTPKEISLICKLTFALLVVTDSAGGQSWPSSAFCRMEGNLSLFLPQH